MSDDNQKIIDFAKKKAEVGSSGRVLQVQNGKMVQIDPGQADPQTTVLVKNEELRAVIETFTKEATMDHLLDMLNQLLNSRILVPANVSGLKQPVPVAIKNEKDQMFQPIFIEKVEVPSAEVFKHEGLLNMPFIVIVNTIVKQELGVEGLVIDYASHNVILSHELLQEVVKFQEEKIAGTIPVEARFEANRLLAIPSMQVTNTVKDGKIVSANTDELDPQTTINLENPELLELIDTFHEDKSNENLGKLINQLEKSRVLLPARLNEQKMPIPLTMPGPEDSMMQPVFTDRNQIPDQPKSEAIMNLPFLSVVDMILHRGPAINALGLNPFTKSVVMKRELLERIEENMQMRAKAAEELLKNLPKVPGASADIIQNADGTTTAQMKLNEQQYPIFERAKFEGEVLPKKLFEDGKNLMEQLASEKEEALDALFEESYVQKRMYPYLPEDFKVITMGISEEQEVAMITMPAADSAPGIAESIYMVYNSAKNEGKYFLFARSMRPAAGGVDVFEITPSGRNLITPTPEEGTELSWVLERAGQ